MKTTLKAIAVLTLIAAVFIGIHAYWFEHSIMQQWGSTLVMVDMFLNMAVILTLIAVLNTKRSQQK